MEFIIMAHLTFFVIFHLKMIVCWTHIPVHGPKKTHLWGSIHRWGTQKECLTPKSLSRHYFEWPSHLQDNLFGRFVFSLDIHVLLDWNGGDFLWFGCLKHVFKCPKRWLKNRVPLCNFVKKRFNRINNICSIFSIYTHK